MDGAEVSGIDFNRRAGQKTPFYLDALICEPDFAAKLKSGAQDGSKCLTCNGCYTIYRKRFVRCVQHQDEIEQFKTIPWYRKTAEPAHFAPVLFSLFDDALSC